MQQNSLPSFCETTCGSKSLCLSSFSLYVFVSLQNGAMTFNMSDGIAQNFNLNILFN